MSHYGPAAAANGGRGPRRPPFHRQQPPPPPPPMQLHRQQQQMNRGPPPPPPPGFGRGIMPGRGRGNGQMMHRPLPPNNNFAMPPQMRSAPPPPPPPPPPDRMNPNFTMPFPPSGPRPPNNNQRQMFQGPSPGMHYQQPPQPQQQTFHQGPPQIGQTPPMYQQQQHPAMHQHQPHPVMQQPPHYVHHQQQHPNQQPAKQIHQHAPQAQHPTQLNNTAAQNKKDSQPNADAAWAEHTSPTGTPYYYNSVTGISTYERPPCLGKSASAVSTNNAKAAVEKRTWRIYTDESSGKKYYSDGVTTTWNRPAELGEEEPAKPNKRASIAEESAPKKKKKENSTSLYSSKAEAVAAFKGLLLAKDIAPHMKWNDVVKICSEDSRWEACSTIGERKQALAEYQTKRSNELKEVKRLEKGRAKEAFGRLLTDILSENWHELTSGGTCRFIDVRELLSKDDRFHSVEDEVTREELFYDFIEESRKREERTRRNKKREVKEGFLTLLRLYEERGKLSFASTWSSFVSQLDEKEKADPNFATGPNMSDSDRQLFFADFVIQLQMAEDEKHRRILEARQRAEKAQRDVYRNRLRSLAEEGYIRPNTRWNLVQEKIAQDASYPPVYAQNREAPRELFEDFVDEWNDEYRRERAVLNRALGMAKELKFDNKTGVEEFRKQILDASSPNPDLYAEVRRILTREDELSTCCLLYNERRDGIKNNGGSQTLKEDESSEDEGEIIEQT